MASVRLFALFAVAVSLVGVASFGSRPSASSFEVVSLATGSVISLRTPDVIQVGRRYAFTWAGGGPSQTYTVKAKREDGWILVDVAEENLNPVYLVSGEVPTRWLNVATAISIQEMRPHQ